MHLSSACRDLSTTLLADAASHPVPGRSHDDRESVPCSCGGLVGPGHLLPVETVVPLLSNMATLFNPDRRRFDATFECLRDVAHTQSPCSSPDYHVGECFNAREVRPFSLEPFLQLVSGLTSIDAVRSSLGQSCQRCQLTQCATFTYASAYWCLLWAE